MNGKAWEPLLHAAQDRIRSVAVILREGDNPGFAQLLDEALASMRGWYSTKEALYKVGVEYCHAKFFGDTFVKDLGWEQWDVELESLR